MQTIAKNAAAAAAAATYVFRLGIFVAIKISTRLHTVGLGALETRVAPLATTTTIVQHRAYPSS